MDLTPESIEDEAVHIASADLTKQLQLEGITVDENVLREMKSQIRGQVSKLIATSESSRSLGKKELAKEALGLSNVTSLKLRARKVMFQKRTEMLTSRRQWFIIHPSHPQKLAWDLFNVILLVYSVFEIPFSLAFTTTEVCSVAAIDNLNLFVDCCFCVDCMLAFITAYIDNDTGIVVVDWSRIASRSVIKFFKNIICKPRKNDS